ncbi:MAG TPA: peptidylprolyl isomerase [Thermoanaerobaculia bacterium]
MTIAFRTSRARAMGLLCLFALAILSAMAPTGEAAAKKAPPKKKEVKQAKPRDYAKTVATLRTSQGDVTIRFLYDKAPGAVKTFVDLAEKGFYDGTSFHRVVPGFAIQGGDPRTKTPGLDPRTYGFGENTDTQGNPILLKAEFSDVTHRRGIVAMARRESDPDSASCQFFIVLKDSPFLDRHETVFGEVTKGMDVIDRIVAESRPNPLAQNGGQPTSYQKILKVELSNEGAGK